MTRHPPLPTRPATLFPYPTLFRSCTAIGGVDPRLNESEKRGFLLGHAANGLGREPGAAAPLRRRDPIDEIERVGVDPCGDDRGLAHVSNVYIRYAAVNLAG